MKENATVKENYDNQRPADYGIHIPKSQRKGKTWQEIRAMRTRLLEGRQQKNG